MVCCEGHGEKYGINDLQRNVESRVFEHNETKRTKAEKIDEKSIVSRKDGRFVRLRIADCESEGLHGRGGAEAQL
jgi:hypothetical protein